MNWNNGSRVLAIGIDAAEPTLIRQLIEQDKLPTLKSLLAEGKWLRVKSPAHIGSGSVWPTFITGEEATRHGVYGEWAWQPQQMAVHRYNGRNLTPFWKALTDEGLRVGLLDVPFAPFLGLSEGFELSEWGPHDLLEGRRKISPAAVNDLVSQSVGPHPLHLDRLDVEGARDHHGLTKLTDECLEGVKLRGALAQQLLSKTKPQFSVIVFTEIHHTGHYLWHTIAPDHALYQQPLFKNLPRLKWGLEDIYCEVDRQIGGLLETVGSDATVLAFSLHGMKPSHGVPTLLEPLLCELGYAKRTDWATKSWTERGLALIASAKRNSPSAVKKAYYKMLPPTTTHRIARPTMLASYHWEHTRAFALPADQHGWVHINLKGREVKGIVPPEQYEEICQELEQMLLGLKASDGRPVVHHVVRTAQNVDQAMDQILPDLVVHWEDTAFSTPLTLKDTGLQTEPAGKKFTGRHAVDGFCILKDPKRPYEGDTLPATEIHRVITRALKAG
jgi:predicted AlkP superfamily phosphohydrolase/phosphomutase